MDFRYHKLSFTDFYLILSILSSDYRPLGQVYGQNARFIFAMQTDNTVFSSDRQII